MQEKIDPYLRPLYDALYDMLDPEKVDRYLEKNVIEIAPIAFMRGRTLNDSFVILDEAQNTTSEQMKMFVTRLGFNSKAVITGDVTQIDLPNANRSGLLEAVDILKNVEGLAFRILRRRRRGAASPGAAHHSRLRRAQERAGGAAIVAVESKSRTAKPMERMSSLLPQDDVARSACPEVEPASRAGKIGREGCGTWPSCLFLGHLRCLLKHGVRVRQWSSLENTWPD